MFTPEQHRGRRRLWLLDLTWGGAVYHLAEEDVEYTAADGTVTGYHAGLLVTGEVGRGAEVGAGSLDAPAVPIELHLEGLVDVPARIANGYPLEAATGVLWLWIDGTSHREKVAEGYIDAPETGEADEPVVASIQDDRLENDKLFPPANAKMGSGSQNPGERYPWVIGTPGSSDAHGSSALVWSQSGTPSTADELLIAGHPVSASSATAYNADTGYSQALSTATTTDSNGRTVSIVDITGWAAADREPTARYFVRWTGGGLKIRGQDVAGAGDVLRWALTQTDIAVEPGRLAALLPTLNQYQIACDITAPPDSRLDLWEWVSAHLLPILPISALRGPDGLDFVLWRWDAVAADAVAHLVEDENAVRLGGVGRSSRRSVRNEFRLTYAPDAATGSLTAEGVLTGDAETLREEAGAVEHRDCVRSRNLFGKRLIWESSSEVVYSETTAFRVLRNKAREFALPAEFVGYSVPAEVGAHLRAGDVVSVTDAGIGWTARLCFVLDKPAAAGDEYGLALRTIRAR